MRDAPYIVAFAWRPCRNHLGMAPLRPDTAASESRAAALAIAFHREMFPGAHIDPDQDYEDWHESVAKLHAAVRTGLPVHILGDDADPTRITATIQGGRLGAPVTHPRDRVILLGTFLCSDPLLPMSTEGEMRFDRSGCCFDIRPDQISWPHDASSTYPVNRYHQLETFRRHAGRRVASVSIPDEDTAAVLPDSIVDVAAAWTATAPLAGKLKAVIRAKEYPVTDFDLPQGAGHRRIIDECWSRLEFGVLMLSGQAGAVLLQDRVPMSYEYRVIVVDGLPVTGAGCIEAFIPASRLPNGDAFDPQVACRRNVDAIEVRPDIARRYCDAATVIAAELLEESPELKDYTLDLAIDGEGRVLIIELNPLTNYGLYACDVDRIVAALRHKVMWSAA